MPATLVKVLEPSSTRTDRTRTRSPTDRSLPEVVEALAERNYRIDVGLRVDAKVDQERAVGPFGRIHRRPDVGELVDPHSRQTVGVRELDEVGNVGELHLGPNPAVEVVLELANHAKRKVVEQHDLDVELMLDSD